MISAQAARWLIALIVALLLGAGAVSTDADPEALEATAADSHDAVADAREAHRQARLERTQ